MSVPVAKPISEMIARPGRDASPGETGYWSMIVKREPNLYPVADGYPATRGDDAHDTASVRRTIGVRHD
jgi:hypothetical protein